MRRVAGMVAASLVFMVAPAHARPLPDLVPIEPRAGEYVVDDRTFGPWDQCAVDEGFIPALGTYHLLEFATTVANIGKADLKIGNPADHPDWFYFSPCHGHYHFRQFGLYQLVDAAGNTVGTGLKQGFCLLDIAPLPGTHTRYRYSDCATNQGISDGWSDVYDRGLYGQWVDVSGVPPGTYTLRVTINYTDVLPESDYSNNSLSIPVTVP